MAEQPGFTLGTLAVVAGDAVVADAPVLTRPIGTVTVNTEYRTVAQATNHA